MKADELWQIILGSERSEWKYEVIHDEHKGVEFGTGAPWSGSGVLNTVQAQLARAGIPKMRLHDLRHGCASLLLAQGVPARVVMEVLGHSQLAITLDTYSHVGANLLGDAAEAINASLRPA